MQAPADDDNVLAYRVPAAAKQLAVSRSALYRLMDCGELPYTHVGSDRRILRRDLLAYLEAGRVAGPHDRRNHN